jgi:holliday junction DNA helicase RuvA
VIALVSGEVAVRRGDHVVVSCGGVGYRLAVSAETLKHVPRLGESVTLFTHLVVREDAHLLFGFATDEERQVFRKLLKISGVGARTALAVLSGMSVSELYQAISTHDGARLTRIPGIGKKTAERLLLELRDKLHAGTGLNTSGTTVEIRSDALNALLALGYSDKEASHALANISPETPVQEALRTALKLLSKA